MSSHEVAETAGAWCRQAREILALAAERAKVVHQKKYEERRAALSDELHQVLLERDLPTYANIRSADVQAQAAANEGDHLRGLKHLAGLRAALLAHRRLANAVLKSQQAVQSLDALPRFPADVKRGLADRVPLAVEQARGADSELAVATLQALVRECADVKRLAGRYDEARQEAATALESLQPAAGLAKVLAGGLRRKIAGAEAAVALGSWELAIEALDKVAPACAQARRTAQQDIEFQSRWAGIKPQYDAVRKRPPADLDEGDAARLDAAWQRSFAASRKQDFAEALAGLNDIEDALVPLIPDGRKVQQQEQDFKSENDRIFDKFGLTIVAAYKLCKIGGAFETTPVGRLAAEVKRLADAAASHEKSGAFVAALQLLPELESALDAAAEPIAECTADADACLKAWVDLQESYELATTGPSPATLLQDLLAMKAVYAQVQAKLADQLFVGATLQQMEGELLPLIAKLNLERDELETRRQTYLADYATTIQANLTEARGFRKKLVNPPDGFEAAMAEAEAALTKAENYVEMFDYESAQFELIQLQYLLDDPIARALGDVKREREACEARFGKESGLSIEWALGADAPKELRQMARGRQEAVIQYRREFEAGNYEDALALIPAIAELAEKIKEDAEFAESSDASTRSIAASRTVQDYVDKGLLAMRPQAEKVQLLKDLLAQNEPLDDVALKIQAELYRSIEMDPDFVAVDEGRRADVVDDIAGDPERKRALLEARDQWPALDKIPESSAKLDKKIAALQKIHDQHCASLGIPTLQVEPVSLSPDNTGGFSAAKEFIAVNIQSQAVQQDFQKSVDLILHETTHWYQANLVKRFLEGEIDEDDAEYTQVLLFAMNDARLRPDAYVQAKDWGADDAAEHNQAYLKQPQEAHAYAAGTEMAKLLMAALNA